MQSDPQQTPAPCYNTSANSLTTSKKIPVQGYPGGVLQAPRKRQAQALASTTGNKEAQEGSVVDEQAATNLDTGTLRAESRQPGQQQRRSVVRGGDTPVTVTGQLAVGGGGDTPVRHGHGHVGGECTTTNTYHPTHPHNFMVPADPRSP